MNRNIIYSIIFIILMCLGTWLVTSRSTPQGTLTPTPSSTKAVAEPAITITSPLNGETVSSPITVTGRARVFENQFTVQVKDSTGKVVASAHVFSDAPDAGLYGNYSVKIPIPAGMATSTMKVEALSYAPKGDGSFEGYASVSVKLNSILTMNTKVAFPVAPIGNDCAVVALFSRKITKTTSVAYVSLTELLKGPSDTEKKSGAITEIPDGVQINSIKIVGDTAYVDFDKTLQEGVAGSCRVLAIRSQITNTLKQFPGVNNVVISINGQTEDILQP